MKTENISTYRRQGSWPTTYGVEVLLPIVDMRGRERVMVIIVMLGPVFPSAAAGYSGHGE
jgi:hypothetical protein